MTDAMIAGSNPTPTKLADIADRLIDIADRAVKRSSYGNPGNPGDNDTAALLAVAVSALKTAADVLKSGV